MKYTIRQLTAHGVRSYQLTNTLIVELWVQRYISVGERLAVTLNTIFLNVGPRLCLNERKRNKMCTTPQTHNTLVIFKRVYIQKSGIIAYQLVLPTGNKWAPQCEGGSILYIHCPADLSLLNIMFKLNVDLLYTVWYGATDVTCVCFYLSRDTMSCARHNQPIRKH